MAREVDNNYYLKAEQKNKTHNASQTLLAAALAVQWPHTRVGCQSLQYSEAPW